MTVFNHSKITAMYTCLGSTSLTTIETLKALKKTEKEAELIQKVTGIEKRSIAESGTTALDLCKQAALKLKTDLSDVDGIIFITSTPDYFQPSNAHILHGALGLQESCLAYDIHLACSGWVYGLHAAQSFIETGHLKKVLLLAGDAHFTDPKDNGTAPLFGDAGSATLVERTNTLNPTWFSLKTIGKDWKALHVPGGAYRNPKITSAGTPRADCLHMDGVEVFHFPLRKIPSAFKALITESKQTIKNIDKVIFHQANKYILTNLAKQLNVDIEKVPVDALRNYGNLSSASIPSVICHELKDEVQQKELKVIFVGFGMGLSIGIALTNLGKLKYCGLDFFQK